MLGVGDLLVGVDVIQFKFAFVVVDGPHHFILLLQPLFDLLVITIEQAKFPSLEETRQQVQASGDTEESHERENNGDLGEVLDQEDKSEEEDLQHGEQMDLRLGDETGVGSPGVLLGLLEEHHETVPELHVAQRGQTHEQEDTVKDGHGQEPEDAKEQEGASEQDVREEHGQAGFLDRLEVSVTVLLGKGVQVDNAWDGGGNQPGKTQETVDKVEDTTQHQVVVVGFSVL